MSGEPVGPSGYCWFHDPAIAEERAQKRQEGGQKTAPIARGRASSYRMRFCRPRNCRECSRKQSATCWQASWSQTGKCCGGAFPALLTIREATELEERLSALEQAAGIERRLA